MFQKGYKQTEEQIRKRIAWAIGKPLSKEQILKLSKSHLGQHSSPKTEFKKGIAPWNKGKTFEELYGIKKAKIMKKQISKFFIGKKHTEEWKVNAGERMKLNNPMKNPEIVKKLSGKNSNFWNGGISFEKYPQEFNTYLKNNIRQRDNQICMNCNIHREKLKEALMVHHINYDKKCSLIQNLISLCRRCHVQTNQNREYWIKLFQDKLSKLYNYKYAPNGDIILEVENVSSN